MVDGDDFFAEMKQNSQVKAEIVKKYFAAWANVLLPSVESRDGKLGYIDLFSGPGTYADGKKSTPILVIEEAINNPMLNKKLKKRLVTLFNDANPEFISELYKEIKAIPGIEELENHPILLNDSIGDKVVEKFEEIKFIPSLFFIDPWGYKGLSLSLLKSVLKDWGCDCIFFFNYNRINMGLTNPYFIERINAIFGEKRAEDLRNKIISMNALDRELTIINELGLAINELGFPYLVPFCFKDGLGKKTSHYLIFISKHERGYEIMKEIMAKYSTETVQGVPTFEYCPATKRQPFLFSFRWPMKGLSEMLLEEFTGQTLTMGEIYHRHHVGKPFIKKNYKAELIKMEEKEEIRAKPSAENRRAGTFGDNVLVTFPEL